MLRFTSLARPMRVLLAASALLATVLLGVQASAVAQTGVDTFIVPAAQGEEDIAAAKEAAGGDLDIIPVNTLDEALAVLEKLGGDPLPE